jgi:hypothetical protein
MSALAGIANNAIKAATTTPRSIALGIFFRIIPFIWLPPLCGLLGLLFCLTGLGRQREGHELWAA